MARQPYPPYTTANAHFHGLRNQLRALGSISPAGIDQFASGVPVTSHADRVQLAHLLDGALDLVARDRGPDQIGLLLPAIQKVKPR